MEQFGFFKTLNFFKMASKKLSFFFFLMSASFEPRKKEDDGNALSYRFFTEVHLYGGLCLKSSIYAFDMQPGISHSSLVDVVLTDDDCLSIKLQKD